jgi:hypothetical protein
VDLTKYHSGAALLRNFFVDYRGGATARAGTKYICQTKFNNITRLIPFQASFEVSYVLEFGEGYVRFLNNGAQVLSGGLPYEIASPYTAAQLANLKFAQNVDTMVICHPDHAPYLLTLITATNWTLVPIVFGATITPPVGPIVTTTLAAGAVNYAYIVTSVDVNGQESAISTYATLASKTDLRSTAGTNTVSWTTVAGAASYNVYKAEPSYAGAVPVGSAFGFAGNVTGTDLIDSNISPDFSQGPPIVQNPFSGAGVSTVSITGSGTYNPGDPVPNVLFTGGGGSGAAAVAVLAVTSIAFTPPIGALYNNGDTITLTGAPGAVVLVTSSFGGQIVTATLTAPGALSAGTIPANPVPQATTSGTGIGAAFNLTWALTDITVSNPGVGYTSAPSVVISSGGATATAVLGPSSSGNPTVPGFFQQRLVLAGPVFSPQQFNMSQTGAYFNFDIHAPLEASDAIQGVLVSGQLNTIKALIPQPQGLIILSDKQAWLLNGGAPGTVVTPATLVANSQAYNGGASIPPIVANDHVLYVQSKGSIVRDLVFNFYTQVYTGTDISVLSSHLFFGYTVYEWAWCEEPFKVVWAVRNDGSLLSLTFLKEQELIAWTHSDTQGLFKSVATITETVGSGAVDSLYMVVERVINGTTVKYIERMSELYYPVGLTDAWSVDCALQYNGAATTSFTGAAHLNAMEVAGLATDNTGVVHSIEPFVMPVGGAFTLPAPTAPATGYTRATVGLAYTPQLQTLALDTNEPTIQGKMKTIPAVTLRVHETLGLEIGKTFASLVEMKDLKVGNVGSATNAIVTDLVTGDAMTRLDPSWTVPGQYCIQQSNPFPASILGVIPQVAVGDTIK